MALAIFFGGFFFSSIKKSSFFLLATKKELFSLNKDTLLYPCLALLKQLFTLTSEISLELHAYSMSKML